MVGFEPNNAGTRTNFSFDQCAFVNNFVMTGAGYYNANTDRFVLNVSITGRWDCDLKYDRRGENVKITGKCDGKKVSN